ncbi:MAG: protein BatD [Alcanivoracaceae bacterium]|nr:protein BatD [Alcanivoracaceae bacterium]
MSVDENISEQPDLSELQQVFRVLGTSQSSSTKIINGDYSVEKSWQISLMPNGVGKNTIPPIKLGQFLTKPIQITISNSDPNTKASGDLFIEVATNKSSAFVKEQIILTVKLFYSIALSEGNLSEPIISNTIVSQLDKGANYTTNRNGKNYTVIERHYALFAEKNGTLNMNPIIFNGRDNTSRRSFSMFSTGKPVRAVSKPLSLEIKPIPQKSIGKDWIPATKVQVSQQWTKQPYKVGEPITRTITLYIEGLSETQIPDIDLGDIDNMRVYPDRPQTQTEKTSETVKAWKQVKLALIPTQAGAIRIPEYQLEWYNTRTDKIEYAKLPPVTIQVDAGEFGVEKPVIGSIMEPQKQAKSEVVTESQQQLPVSIKVIEKDNLLWKVLTAIFALMWLITFIFYFKKQTKTATEKNEKKLPVISKKHIISAINDNSPANLQKYLLSWWNQQHHKHQVTNLSQIKPWLNQQMQQLIDDLELQLYNSGSESELNQSQWLKYINGNGLNLIKHNKVKKKIELPELY